MCADDTALWLLQSTKISKIMVGCGSLMVVVGGEENAKRAQSILIDDVGKRATTMAGGVDKQVPTALMMLANEYQRTNECLLTLQHQ